MTKPKKRGGATSAKAATPNKAPRTSKAIPGRGRSPTPAQMAAIHRRMFEAERDLWLREHPGRTKREFNRLIDDQTMTSEVWVWRRAKIGKWWARERRAWRRDFPGRPWPEHPCSLSDKEHDEYAAWCRRRGWGLLP